METIITSYLLIFGPIENSSGKNYTPLVGSSDGLYLYYFPLISRSDPRYLCLLYRIYFRISVRKAMLSVHI